MQKIIRCKYSFLVFQLQIVQEIISHEDNVVYRLGTTIVSRADYIRGFENATIRTVEIEVS